MKYLFRSDVWSLGCLLYAWYYGFSPYEISFDKHGMAVSSECSYLRILSGVIPRPPHISLTSAEERILDLVNSILVQDFRCRPFIDQLLQKVEHTIQLDAGERNNDIFPSQSTV
jgi:serine/threonine protein kinase